MSDTHEPLAAILAEMREFCSGWSEDVDVTVKVGLIYGWACRLDAAAKREKYRDTIYAGRDGEMMLDECIVRCDNNSGDNPRGRDIAQIGSWLRELRALRTAPGNAAALREALNFAADTADIVDADIDCCESEYNMALCDIREKARAALAAPARNCDVYPASEWRNRFYKFCGQYTHKLCRECPLHEKWDFSDGKEPSCMALWAVAPAEGGAGEDKQMTSK